MPYQPRKQPYLDSFTIIINGCLAKKEGSLLLDQNEFCLETETLVSFFRTSGIMNDENLYLLD